jgi:ATP-dependent phosphofructokinase / diphosphate-dependent phosphofructokinase
MQARITGNMVIAQSGGPSMVINQSLVGAVLEARRHPNIKYIFGARHGIRGMLAGDFVDLRKEPARTLEAVAATPSSALGTVRQKPTAEDCRAMFAILQQHNIRYFFYIGGNDSAETAHIVSTESQRQGYPMACFHIPKTIDNDLCENDHTPGFGSAARFVACAVMGDDLDNRALGGVKIDIVMGRHAGFLTAAAALARRAPDDGPHLIYLPERPFDIDRFAADIARVYERLGRCVVAVSEGIVNADGKPIAAAFSDEIDPHGNVQLSGTGALGDLLARELKARTGYARVRADTFGYLQRSFPGIASPVDAREARAVGAAAVRVAATQNGNGSIAIVRHTGARYRVMYKPVPLRKVARRTRHMPARFIAKAGNDVTPAFLAYAAPLVGALPPIARLNMLPIKS